jgi:hypothetical protein
MIAVAQFEACPPKQPKPHTGVPTYFRALCREVAQGGSLGFRVVGRRFAKSLAGEIPYEQTLDEWQAELNVLRKVLTLANQWEPLVRIRHADLREGVWGWFARNYPKAMKLIPARRREQFIMGVMDAFADETIALDL